MCSFFTIFFTLLSALLFFFIATTFYSVSIPKIIGLILIFICWLGALAFYFLKKEKEEKESDLEEKKEL